MRERNKNLIILGIIPLTVTICLLIKMIIQETMIVNTSIELCDLFWLNYTQHICEYLDLQYGVEAIGRILVLMYMLITLSLEMFEDKKHYEMMMKLDLFYVGAILVSNILFKETSLLTLAGFIINLQAIYIVYFSDRLSSHLKKDGVKVMIALYIGGSLGNIIEMNIVGWVTDYLYFLPAYGFKAVSNLEDWITWSGQWLLVGYGAWNILKWVGSNFKVYITQREQRKAGE